MKHLATIRRAIAIFMIATFALAPLIRPAMAQKPSDVTVSAAAVDDMTMAMSDGGIAEDMPCCPSKAPQPVDCDKCLLMAVCMTKCINGHADASLEPFFMVAGSMMPPVNDFWPDGLGNPPPDHPPRTLI